MTNIILNILTIKNLSIIANSIIKNKEQWYINLTKYLKYIITNFENYF